MDDEFLYEAFRYCPDDVETSPINSVGRATESELSMPSLLETETVAAESKPVLLNEESVMSGPACKSFLTEADNIVKDPYCRLRVRFASLLPILASFAYP